jgi:tetratricopeptide (TPR) repeat protein
MSSFRELTFISYANEDVDFALKISKGLEERKIKTWIDKKDLKPGKFKPQIIKAITRSKYFIICISNSALKKTGVEPGFQDEELSHAYTIATAQTDKDFVIIPVRIEDCDRGDHRLSIWQQYDLFKDFSQNLDKLAVDIGGISLSDTEKTDERNNDEIVIDNLINRASAEYYAGAFQNSLDLLKAIELVKPDIPDVLNLKGITLSVLNRNDEALIAFDKAIEIEPKFFLAWNNKGNVLNILGRKDEALIAFDMAIDIEPKYILPWNNKGIVLFDLGRKDEALIAYDNAIDIEPKYADAWYNKGHALAALGRNEEALIAYDNAIDINPKRVHTWFKKGNVLSTLGRNEEALIAYNKAIDVDPNSFGAWYYRACFYALIKQKDKMISDLKIATNLNVTVKKLAKVDNFFKEYLDDADFKKLTS